MVAATAMLVLLCLHGGVAYRLPKSVVPVQYSLELITHLGEDGGNFTFQGRVAIEVDVLEPTNNVTLHSKDLDIAHDEVKVRVLGLDDEDMRVGQHLDPENDFYVIKLRKPLEKGSRYLVEIPFSGELTEKLVGYYRSSYLDRKTNQTRWMAVTHFEPTYAPRAFPCFDEPQLKARLNVSLGRRGEFTSASNMPLRSTEPMEGSPGWFWDHFDNSEPMSTYLFAFMVSDFNHRDTASGPVSMRVWARPGAFNQTEYAADVTPKILSFYEQYFDLKYPLPKLDLVAVPDFSFGGMENWGLITFREGLLTFDPASASVLTKKSVVELVAHELAHQWFGNLVTMKWWTDLWLNEGFAVYVQTLGADHVHPNWRFLEVAAAESVLSVFANDGLESSHPVSVPIGHPNEINQIFDSISYQKGSLLLRMMNSFLGEDVFRRGVNAYLKQHRLGNAQQDDLWASLNAQAHAAGVLPQGFTISNIMDTWTLQTGFPLVTVLRDYDKQTAQVSQVRYLTSTAAAARGTSQECWVVPLSYTTKGTKPSKADSSTKHWLACNTTSDEIRDIAAPHEWVLFNINMTGVYRVHYDDRNWRLLYEALTVGDHRVVPVLNRLQLINDALDLAWTGRLDYGIALGMLEYLGKETEFLPWKGAVSRLSSLFRMLNRTPVYGQYKRYLKSIVAPVYSQVGNLATALDADDIQTTSKRIILSGLACKLGLKECVDEAKALYREWMESEDPDQGNRIPTDLKSTVYCTAMTHGGEEEWDFGWKRYINSNVEADKMALLITLGCTEEVWLLTRYLNWSLDESSGIRRHDALTVFYSVLVKTDVGFYVAKEFFMGRIADLHAFYGPKPSSLSGYVTGFGYVMFTEGDLKQFEAFLKDNEHFLPESALAGKQSLESIRVNVEWHRDHYDKFRSHLDKYAH